MCSSKHKTQIHTLQHINNKQKQINLKIIETEREFTSLEFNQREIFYSVVF